MSVTVSLLLVAMVIMAIFIKYANSKYCLTMMLGEVFAATAFVVAGAFVAGHYGWAVWLTTTAICGVVLVGAGMFAVRYVK